MALLVQKFGGTSVADVERIKSAAERVIKAKEAGHDVVVVVSAMSGETNRLIDLAHTISERPSQREYAVAVSTGEQVTMALFAMYLIQRGYEARSYTGGQAKIVTDSHYQKARILEIDGSHIKEDLAKGTVVIVAGFQGIDETGDITVLGRGGSDTTAVALAAALKADECQIYTDVAGVYTADPRVVSDARCLAQITFEEMLEMSSLGAKVLQKRAVEFAGKYKVVLRVLSSFEESPGTLVSFEEKPMEQPVVSGIAFNRDEAKLTIMGVPDTPGIAAKIIGPIGDAGIDIDMIIQNMGQDDTTDFTFTVHRDEYRQALEILQEIAKNLHAQGVIGDQKIAKISIVGVGMRSHAGIASSMFQILGKEGVNIQLIATSEIKISVCAPHDGSENGTLYFAYS